MANNTFDSYSQGLIVDAGNNLGAQFELWDVAGIRPWAFQALLKRLAPATAVLLPS